MIFFKLLSSILSINYQVFLFLKIWLEAELVIDFILNSFIFNDYISYLSLFLYFIHFSYLDLYSWSIFYVFLYRSSKILFLKLFFLVVKYYLSVMVNYILALISILFLLFFKTFKVLSLYLFLLPNLNLLTFFYDANLW